MTAAAAVCFVIAMFAELAGVLLIVKEAGAARRALARWKGPAAVSEIPDFARRRDVQLAHYQLEADDEVIDHLLGSQANRRWAIGLLLAGILVGTLGNFLSLSW